MAFVPFADSDIPSRENFNAKFAEAIAEAKSQALSAGVRIVTGSYVGDGTYGEEHPVHLEFEDIQPVLVMIFGDWHTADPGIGTFFANGLDEYKMIPVYCGTASNGPTRSLVYFKFGQKCLDFYSKDTFVSSDAEYNGGQQANRAGYTYYYLAIGQGVEA